jgi:hypothetical protein
MSKTIRSGRSSAALLTASQCRVLGKEGANHMADHIMIVDNENTKLWHIRVVEHEMPKPPLNSIACKISSYTVNHVVLGMINLTPARCVPCHVATSFRRTSSPCSASSIAWFSSGVPPWFIENSSQPRFYPVFRCLDLILHFRRVQYSCGPPANSDGKDFPKLLRNPIWESNRKSVRWRTSLRQGSPASRANHR